MSKCSKNEVDK